MTPKRRLSNLAVLALGIAVPRVLYVLASVADDDGLRSLAWLLDCLGLLACAWVFVPLQRDFGGDDTKTWARLASVGFVADAVTTLLSRFVEVPWYVFFVAWVAWIAGVTRWLAASCERYGAEYFVYRLWVISWVASYVVRFLQPEWPVFFWSFTLVMVGVAVQIGVVARAIADNDDDKRNIAPP